MKRKFIEASRVLPLIESICTGYAYDPGSSDLDNEQPILVRMTMGDYRRATGLKYYLHSDSVRLQVEK